MYSTRFCWAFPESVYLHRATTRLNGICVNPRSLCGMFVGMANRRTGRFLSAPELVAKRKNPSDFENASQDGVFASDPDRMYTVDASHALSVMFRLFPAPSTICVVRRRSICLGVKVNPLTKMFCTANPPPRAPRFLKNGDVEDDPQSPTTVGRVRLVLEMDVTRGDPVLNS